MGEAQLARKVEDTSTRVVNNAIDVETGITYELIYNHRLANKLNMLENKISNNIFFMKMNIDLEKLLLKIINPINGE